MENFRFSARLSSYSESKAVFSSQNLLDFYQIIRRHIPEDSTFFIEYGFHSTALISVGFPLHNDSCFNFRVMRADLYQTKTVLILSKTTVQELEM